MNLKTYDICLSLPSNLKTSIFPLSYRDIIALKYIIANKKFKLLQLRDESLSVRHLKLLTPALTKNMPTRLSIININIGDEGVAVIADSIKGTNSLSHLALINIGITEVSANVLGQALCCSSVVLLSVSQNKLRSAGLTRLMSYLYFLAISDCAIGDEGMIFLRYILLMTKIIVLQIGGI